MNLTILVSPLIYESSPPNYPAIVNIQWFVAGCFLDNSHIRPPRTFFLKYIKMVSYSAHFFFLAKHYYWKSYFILRQLYLLCVMFHSIYFIHIILSIPPLMGSQDFFVLITNSTHQVQTAEPRHAPKCLHLQKISSIYIYITDLQFTCGDKFSYDLYYSFHQFLKMTLLNWLEISRWIVILQETRPLVPGTSACHPFPTLVSTFHAGAGASSPQHQLHGQHPSLV